MKIEELREKALKKANDIEALAAKNNANCLLMPAYQDCLQAVKICDDLKGRTDETAERLADELAEKIGLPKTAA